MEDIRSDPVFQLFRYLCGKKIPNRNAGNDWLFHQKCNVSAHQLLIDKW
jgi:hypothetical protein